MYGERIIQYLYNNHIRYNIISHPASYTAQGTAHSAHISGKQIAKTVIIKIDGVAKMMVIPGNLRVNLHMLKSIFWANRVELVSEDELKALFPDCEIGGMPPFGNLYGIDVYVARELTKDNEIAFNAGNHRELIKMNYNDFARMVHPNVMEFAER